jgi:2-polyprenyl-6-hydroxyphenyl methylase/3-demethylubiquinone-9 3-methyltransferase
MSKADGVLPEPQSAPLVDAGELAKFAPLAERWWDASGPMRPLHKLNPLRLEFILDQAGRQFGRRKGDRHALENLEALDVGCGGGLLTEPLARLGARVTGIDPATANVDTARWHAREAGLAIAYEAATLEDLVARRQRFDLVLALEVIEHVPDQAAFVASLAETVRPGGLVVMATLSRTLSAFGLAVVGAEYVLGWLPHGTHSWRRFVKPSELARLLRAHGLRLVSLTGVAYDPAHDRFVFRRDPSVNYMLAAARDT